MFHSWQCYIFYNVIYTASRTLGCDFLQMMTHLMLLFPKCLQWFSLLRPSVLIIFPCCFPYFPPFFPNCFFSQQIFPHNSLQLPQNSYVKDVVALQREACQERNRRRNWLRSCSAPSPASPLWAPRSSCGRWARRSWWRSASRRRGASR